MIKNEKCKIILIKIKLFFPSAVNLALPSDSISSNPDVDLCIG